MNQDRSFKHVRAAWTDVILVCRKCSKKLDGGFGEKGDERLAKSLRKTLAGKAKGRKAPCAIIEVDCLDICPKNAVTVINARNPTAWLVVPSGAPLSSIVEQLGMGGLQIGDAG